MLATYNTIEGSLYPFDTDILTLLPAMQHIVVLPHVCFPNDPIVICV